MKSGGRVSGYVAASGVSPRLDRVDLGMIFLAAL